MRRLFFVPVLNYFKGKVLDIGAGTGEFLEYYPCSVGVDINRDCVDFCMSKGLECLHADAYNLPFPDNTFDGVLLNNILEHLDRPEQTLEEAARVLRDEGRICIEVPGSKGFRHDPTHMKYLVLQDLETLLKGRGFRVISSNYFPVPFRWAGDILTHNKLRIFAVLSKERKNQFS
ncbi:MAG: class I SAM-dependent methyltransferase [Thermodesulfovibrionales bacterium]|nr:class I SAM-dependent methyltransferase [Thermodesulfovibrionales bacterium]